jgi:hypothetical protein
VFVRELSKVVNVVCEERWDFHCRQSLVFLECSVLLFAEQTEKLLVEYGWDKDAGVKETTPRWRYHGG